MIPRPPATNAGRIRRLPDSLVNKIAAGEVVERPASVVKELVENALDAGAQTISVDLRDGGGARIRVTDDGVGMTAEELPVALERHATSKLARDEDLESIATLGFRGEALPAVCAVSRFTITTRSRQAPDGTRIAGEAGVITQRLSVLADAGTTVEVRDLFFNTPARLKFLKSPATEVALSLRMLTNLAVAHPDVQLRATSNARPVLTAPQASDLRERLGALWGYDIAGRLLAVDRNEHAVTVHGFASPPDLTRGNREDISVIINGRPVRDPALLQAVLEAYRPLVPRDRFPMVALAVSLSPRDVDVNVHPTKAWVRFREPRLIREMIMSALADALRHRTVVPTIDVTGESPGTERGPVATDEQPPLFREAAEQYATPLFGRVLGQVQQTFVVSTSDEEVFFLDQHVAHERVLFERLQREVAGGPVASQALLFPESIDLSGAARAALEQWREPLERLGFAFEEFGGDAVLVRAVPGLLRGDEPRALIEALADEFTTLPAGKPELDRVLAFVACRAAVKANTPLGQEEMERLVMELGAAATPYFCPHGRPIVSRISMLEIRRELKRTW